MFFKKKHKPTEPAPIDRQMREIIAGHMPDADDETVRLVTAVAGLLAAVAYADRDYAAEEQAHIEQALSQVHGLSPRGVETVCDLLSRRIVELAAANSQAYTRDLRQLAARETRVEILQVLVDLAAADGSITTEETNLLRRTTTAMGLEDGDYLAAQSQHRDRLSVLNPDR